MVCVVILLHHAHCKDKEKYMLIRDLDPKKMREKIKERIKAIVEKRKDSVGVSNSMKWNWNEYLDTRQKRAIGQDRSEEKDY